MLKLLGFINSVVLIGIIFLVVPQESTGLSGFGTKSGLLGSSSSAQRLVNILITFGTLVYFGIAIKLNVSNN